MEEAFQKLIQEGKNNVDHIIKWMKDANIIDGTTVTEQSARDGFRGVDAQNVGLGQFTDALRGLAGAHSRTVDEMTSSLMEEQIDKYCSKLTVIKKMYLKWTCALKSMEEAFEKLRKDGKNNVDNLIQWMKDCTPKIIDGVKVTEEQARKLFEGADQTNVELAKFKEAISKLALEHKRSAEDMTKSLAEQGTKLTNALKAGVDAFKNAMK